MEVSAQSLAKAKKIYTKDPGGVIREVIELHKGNYLVWLSGGTADDYTIDTKWVLCGTATSHRYNGQTISHADGEWYQNDNATTHVTQYLHFSELKEYTVNYTRVKLDPGSGTVSASKYWFRPGEVVQASTFNAATPPSGYEFAGWEYSGSVIPTSYTVPDSNVTLTAKYTKLKVYLEIGGTKYEVPEGYSTNQTDINSAMNVYVYDTSCQPLDVTVTNGWVINTSTGTLYNVVTHETVIQGDCL